MIPVANSYYSGGGLFDIGLQKGGVEIGQSFEIEPVCCETQRRNFKHNVVQCDISQKLVKADNHCHIMIATYPCTKYSTAADIHGTRTGDEHFLHFFRHVAIGQPDVSRWIDKTLTPVNPFWIGKNACVSNLLWIFRRCS